MTCPYLTGSVRWAPLAAALVILLAGCHRAQEAPPDAAVPVQVAEARHDSIQRILTAEGILHPEDQATIIPKITAPVRKFFVNRGDHVKTGQLLAELENRDLAAAVTDAKGVYDQAQAAYRNTSTATVPDEVVKAQQDVRAAEQAADAAQKVLQSRQQLLKEGALARRLVDEANVSYVQAASTLQTAQKHLESLQNIGRHEEVKGAQGQLLSTQGKYQGAVAQLSYSQIRSPINGVVTDRPLFPGEIATAGTPLLTVMNVSRVIARATIPVSQAVYVKVGQAATMTQTDAPISATGKVTVVSPAVDPNSTTVEIWIEAANPGERLRPGVTVHVSVVTETISDAIVVPPEALLPSQSGGTVLMVVGPDSVAHERKIEIGAREPDKVQITKGLQPGEKVVTVGGVGLADAAKVRVVKPNEKESDGAKDNSEK